MFDLKLMQGDRLVVDVKTVWQHAITRTAKQLLCLARRHIADGSKHCAEVGRQYLRRRIKTGVSERNK